MLIGDFYYEIPKTLPQLNATSFYFVAFCFVVFCLCRPFKSFFRPYVLLLANTVFAYSFGLYNLKWLLALSVLSYLISILINKIKNKHILYASNLFFIGMLFVFKYDSTFVGRLIMPLGISFYIFKIVSYLNDIYKEKIECEFNPILYLDYVMFFPCITAGPINRAKDFFEELKSKHEFEYTDISTGFFMLAVGLFEKVVVCDFIKTVTIRCLDNVELTGINVLLGVILYSFEIYLDFDSYSNIAIGIARMLGFKLKKNFNVPYLSAGIKDFWNRWHISLSSWLKDYIYIPLGGSRKGIVRQYLNILIVFLFSSLWHGMTVNFVIWGMGHAVFRVLEDTFERYVYPGSKNKFIALFEKLLKIVLTFVLVTILWVFFRYQNVNDALAVFNRIIDGGSFSYETIGLTLMEFKWLVILVVSVILSDLIRYFTDIFEFMGKRIFILRWALYVVMILVFLVFGVYGGGAFEAGDFIYKWF